MPTQRCRITPSGTGRYAVTKGAVCGVRSENAATDDVLVFILYRGVPREFLTTAKRVRKCVNEHVGIVVSHVIPVSRIPKTTSGKTQRYLLAAAYQKGEFGDVRAKLHELNAEIPGAVSGACSEIE